MQSIQDAEPTSWFDYFGFTSLQIDTATVLATSDILSELNSRIKIQYTGITKMKPAEHYRLHTDSVRGVSINMLIQHHQSQCMFVGDLQKGPYIELCYEPGVLYVFNSQIPHTVINLSENRYMFSIQFQEPRQVLKYADVVRHLKYINKNSIL
jgi:hypothetical protein